MKKIIILTLTIIALASCSMPLLVEMMDHDARTDYLFEHKASDHDIYYGDFGDEIDSIADIGIWLLDNIDYRHEDVDIWSGPETTVTRGYGDCDDLAILFINIAYVELGIKMDLVLVNTADYSRSIEVGGSVNHAVEMYDGVIYENTGRIILDAPVRYRYTFDEVFN